MWYRNNPTELVFSPPFCRGHYWGLSRLSYHHDKGHLFVGGRTEIWTFEFEFEFDPSTPKFSFSCLCCLATLWCAKGRGWYKRRYVDWRKRKSKYTLYSVMVPPHRIVMKKSQDRNSSWHWLNAVYHAWGAVSGSLPLTTTLDHNNIIVHIVQRKLN